MGETIVVGEAASVGVGEDLNTSDREGVGQ